MPKIFISYRRADSTATPSRLFDVLSLHFGPRSVLMDVSEIGTDFRQHLADSIGQCDVVLIVIGKRWKGVKRDDGYAIQSEFDPIRLEVEAAILGHKIIMPILVDDAAMPHPSDIPTSIVDLCYRNAIAIDNVNFREQMEQLCRSIERLVAIKAKSRTTAAEQPTTDREVVAAPPVLPRSAKIVLSYRRSDSAGVAGRLFDRISERYGKQSVFMDIDSIPFGTKFGAYIEHALSECKVLIALIGPKWLGNRFLFKPRIHDDDDPVRIEVASALKMNIPVLPVLLDGMRMPTKAQLPPDLQSLVTINAPELNSGRDFDIHVKRVLITVHGLVEG
jgi:hypothetical protein